MYQINAQPDASFILVVLTQNLNIYYIALFSYGQKSQTWISRYRFSRKILSVTFYYLMIRKIQEFLSRKASFSGFQQNKMTPLYKDVIFQS